jgi:hypothetical protein
MEVVMSFLKTRSTEAVNWAMAIVAVVAIGFGTATAAITVAPQEMLNPAMRPLSSGPAIQFKSAYGQDDEDCFWAIHKVVQADGRVKEVRSLECAQ